MSSDRSASRPGNIELIQLAVFLRMSIDGLPDHHPRLQWTVVDMSETRT